MDAQLRIGTSGYSYKHWMNGVFYPPGLPASRWFEHYASQFRTVELNITFYRLPRPEVFASWRKRAPEGFDFFVKGSRYITHIQRLKDASASLKRFYAAVSKLGDRLAGTLWQLAPQFKVDAARLEKFLRLLRRYPQAPHVFEFRDAGWFNDRVTGLLREHGASYCRADRRDFYKGLDIPDTSHLVYIRRHGPDYGRPPDWDYAPGDIARDASEIRGWLRRGKTVYVYYNNDGGGAAVRDARSLGAAVREDPDALFKKPPMERRGRAA